MLQSPLPGWLRQRIVEVVSAYKEAAGLAEQRCDQIAVSGRRNDEGRLCDDTATLDQFRSLAKYCAGVATRLPLLLNDRLTKDERLQIVKELAHLEVEDLETPLGKVLDPKEIARRAFRDPWQNAQSLPPPDEAIRQYRTHKDMRILSQREAEVFILCRQLRMTEREAGRYLNISTGAVERALWRAEDRLRPIRANGKR